MTFAGKRKILMVLSLFTIIIISWFYLGNNRADMFVDEITTHLVSNETLGVRFRDIPENVNDAIYTKQDLNDFLAVNDDTRFNFKNVYENYDKDVHPPLYGFLLNIAYSLYPYKFSKWIGLTLNLILYLVTVLFVYLTADKLFKRRSVAIVAAYIYGMSVSGLSAMIFIRMYILLTLLTILLAYEILCFIENGKQYMYPIIGITVFLGLMTQYSYVYYAFFACLFVLVYLISKKEYKRAVLFSTSALLGVIMMLVLWTPFFKDISGGQVSSGDTLLDNTKNISAWFGRMETFYQFIFFGTILIVPVAFGACAILLFRIKRIKELKASKDTWIKLTVLLVPAYLTFLVVAISSPALFEQYTYHIAVFHIFTLCIFVWLCDLLYEEKRILRKIAVLAVVLATIPAFLHYKAHWLYQDHKDYGNIFLPYGQSPCLVIDSALENEYITLMNFDDIFVTGDILSEKGTEYIENHSENEKLTVFYRKSAPLYENTWAQGEEFYSEIEKKTGYKYEKTLLKDIGGGAVAYLFTK